MLMKMRLLHFYSFKTFKLLQIGHLREKISFAKLSYIYGSISGKSLD